MMNRKAGIDGMEWRRADGNAIVLPTIAPSPVSAQALAELIEQLARALQQSCYAGGLKPAQWGAMRYFGRANPTACTVTGLASGMMTTKGSTSQTVRALRRKRMLEARRDGTDHRIVRLALSRQGRAMLTRDPLNQLVAALGALPASTLVASAVMVETVVKALYEGRQAVRTRRSRPLRAEDSDASAT